MAIWKYIPVVSFFDVIDRNEYSPSKFFFHTFYGLLFLTASVSVTFNFDKKNTAMYQLENSLRTYADANHDGILSFDEQVDAWKRTGRNLDLDSFSRSELEHAIESYQTDQQGGHEILLLPVQ